MGSPPIVPSVTEGTLGGEPPPRPHHGNLKRLLDTRCDPRDRLDYCVMIRALIYAAVLYFGLIGVYRLAHAENIPATPSTYGQLITSWQSSSYIASTPEGACSQQIVSGWAFQSVEMDGLYRAACRFKRAEDGLIATVAYANAVMGCNAGDRLVDGGMCETYTCPSGYTKNADGISCNRQSCPTGQVSSGRYLMNSAPSQSFCSGGCFVAFTGVWPSHTDGQNLYGEGVMEYSGDFVGECSGSDVPTSGGGSAQPATPPNQQGECSSGNSVTINGTTTCMPSGDPGSGDDSGSGDDTGNGDDTGSGDDNGNGDDTGNGEDSGNGDGDGEQDPTNDDFCAKNPDTSICKDRSASGECESFSCSGDAIDCSIARAAWEQACRGRKRSLTDSGDCDTTPTCEGDAIDCAIAKFSWKAKCAWDWATKTNDFSDEFARAKADMGNPDALITEDSSSVFSYQSHISGPAQCPAAISIPVFGHVVTAPTDWVCGYLGVIAIVLKIAAWLIVGRMVLGAF